MQCRNINYFDRIYHNNHNVLVILFIMHYRLESSSRRIELSGPQGVTIESRAGDIIVSCLMDVKLESIAGAVRIIYYMLYYVT